MNRRILTAVLAVVLAVAGTAVVLLYVKQADKRALAGQRAVTVLVAGQLIPAGTTASTALHDGMLRNETLPAESVPSDALRSIPASLAALVASSDIQPGELLLRSTLVPAAVAQAAGGLAVPPGMVAVSINLCLPEAVGDYVHAGSQVSIYDTALKSPGQNSQQSLSAASNCGGSHQQQAAATTSLVLSQVQVLAVGQAPPSNPTGSTALASNSTASSSSSGATLVTFAVTPAQAKQLILLTVTGLPYLALLN